MTLSWVRVLVFIHTDTQLKIFTTTDANQAPILFLWECEYIYKAPYHIYVPLFRIGWFPSTPKRLKDFFCFLVLPV